MGDEPTRLQAFREARDELRKLLREFIAAEKRAAG
jgi:hypothetical protein